MVVDTGRAVAHAISGGERNAMDRTLVAAHIAKRLSLRRSELRLSLTQIAARCQVSPQQIHRYETGENVLSVAMLWQLSKCLDVEIGYFFEGI